MRHLVFTLSCIMYKYRTSYPRRNSDSMALLLIFHFACLLRKIKKIAPYSGMFIPNHSDDFQSVQKIH